MAEATRACQVCVPTDLKGCLPLLQCFSYRSFYWLRVLLRKAVRVGGASAYGAHPAQWLGGVASTYANFEPFLFVCNETMFLSSLGALSIVFAAALGVAGRCGSSGLP